MMNEKSNTYTLTPTKFVYGGDAMGRLPDGRAVFIPFAVPGEEVQVRLTEDKKRYARAEILDIIQPAQKRKEEPRCPHFGTCGGCHYQHLDYQEQLAVKENILRDQLKRLGGLEDPPVKEILPSPAPWYYRNQVQFHLTPAGELGFVGHDTEEVVSIRECHLLDETLQAVWPTLNIDQVPGLDRVILRSGEGDEDALLVLDSQDPQPVEFEVDYPISVVHQGPGGRLVLSGDEFTILEVHGFPFVVSAGSFFQVNLPATETLVDHVLEVMPLSEEKTLLDLYCGV